MPVSIQNRVTMAKLPTRDKTGVPRSQAERLWLMGGGLVALVLVLIGFFFFIRPERSNTSDVNGQVATVRQQNGVLQARLDALREQNNNLAKYQAALAAARLALPSTSGVPDFLRTLQALGNATQTDVTALSVGQPTDVTPQLAATPTAEATTGPSATATSAPTATAAPAGEASTAAGTGVYALPINATVSGSSAALARFLDQLQSVQPRAVLITAITEAPDTGTGATRGSMTLQLTMNAFVAPSSPSEGASLSAASH